MLGKGSCPIEMALVSLLWSFQTDPNNTYILQSTWYLCFPYHTHTRIYIYTHTRIHTCTHVRTDTHTIVKLLSQTLSTPLCITPTHPVTRSIVWETGSQPPNQVKRQRPQFSLWSRQHPLPSASFRKYLEADLRFASWESSPKISFPNADVNSFLDTLLALEKY